jgi:outer membrane protein assembly factor BamA
MGQLPSLNHQTTAVWARASQQLACFARILGCLWLVLAVDQVGRAQQVLVDSVGTVGAVSDSFYIRDIHLECNHKTIDRIILRELQYRAGSRIAKQGINLELQREASKIFNTNLFVLAEVFHFPVQGDTIDLIVSVVEKWYIYPVPIFELADRNFNEWWQQRGRDLDRTVFGIRFTQQNFRGRNEDLKLTLQLGFTRKIEFEYNIPYVDRRQTVGLNFRLFYDNNKNLPYRTDNHKLSFLRMDDVLRERFSAEVGMFKRSQFYNTHFLDLRYHQQGVADTIVQLNPDYFLDGRAKFRYTELVYTFNRDLRDMAAYPLKGMLLRLTVNQKGLGAFDDLNQFSLTGLYAKFIALGKRSYYSGSFRGYASFPQRQPFVEMRTFGYQSQFPRGYDLYVIDGQHWGVWKNTGRFRLFSRNLQNDWIKLEQFRVMPVAVYLKAYADAGYVVNPLAGPDNQRLTNRALLGTGVGLDLVLYNTSVFRFEYSFNREGDRGFYFNLMADF